MIVAKQNSKPIVKQKKSCGRSAVKHSERPPCDCDRCLAKTAQADRRRAEISDILERVDDAMMMVEMEVTRG